MPTISSFFQRSFINMFRALRSSSIAVLSASVLLVGCSQSSAPKTNEAPVKVTQGVDKKGNKTKTMDASMEDPSVQKK
jgi:PBP1b-binding outer membrane lipoprotein LpoB